MNETPNEFFLRNGGSSIFKLNGDNRTPSLLAFLSTRWKKWPKVPGAPAVDPEKVPSKNSETSMPGSQALGMIAIWNGGMILRTSVCIAAPECVAVERPLTLGKYCRLAAGPIMDLPRPLLLFTVGMSYDNALRNLRVSVDPDVVECGGSEPFTIRRGEVETIDEFCRLFGIEPKAAADLRSSLEVTLASDAKNTVTRAPFRSNGAMKMMTRLHTNHPKVVKQVRQLADLPTKASEDPDTLQAELNELGTFWSAVSNLPMRSSPAWNLTMFPQENEQK